MANNIIVKCKDGLVKGFVECAGINKINVNVFHNIPFAKPPVGELRFMKPLPAASWDGVRDCTKRGKIPWQSMQIVGEGDKFFAYRSGIDRTINACGEDCLHTSVYTPSTTNKTKLPVMVWIYGGAFSVGSSDIYEGSILSSMNDVVIVVPNYRVNAFGFLSMGSGSICPGNAGLHDQLLALRWVQENIEFFGGDPNNVTIFGESAGGASVGFHINSSLSNGLFHKAISHSGEATMPLPGMFVQNARKLTFELCKMLDVDGSTDEEVLKNLQRIPADEINTVVEFLALKRKTFSPVVDGEFVADSPSHFLTSSHQLNRVPHIIGYNDSEGDGILSNSAIKGFYQGISHGYATRLNQIFLEQNWPSVNHKKSEKQLMEYYSKMFDEDDPCRFSKVCGAFKRDALFRIPAHLTADCHSDNMPTFMYHGTFQPRYNHCDEHGPNNIQKADWVGCDHSDDIDFTFGFPFAAYDFANKGLRFTEAERTLSRNMMNYFCNFAKNGNPNHGVAVDTNWPEYNKTSKNILQLDSDEIQVVKDDATTEIYLWAKVTSNDVTAKL